jgi:hypothetical protein
MISSATDRDEIALIAKGAGWDVSETSEGLRLEREGVELFLKFVEGRLMGAAPLPHTDGVLRVRVETYLTS